MAPKFKLGNFSKVEFIRLKSNFASLCSNKSNKILLEAIFYRSLETLSLAWWDSCPQGNNNSRRCFRTIFHFTLKLSYELLLLSPFFFRRSKSRTDVTNFLFFALLPPIIKMNWSFYNSFSHNFHIHTLHTVAKHIFFCQNIDSEFSRQKHNFTNVIWILMPPI